MNVRMDSVIIGCCVRLRAALVVDGGGCWGHVALSSPKSGWKFWNVSVRRRLSTRLSKKIRQLVFVLIIVARLALWGYEGDAGGGKIL